MITQSAQVVHTVIFTWDNVLAIIAIMGFVLGVINLLYILLLQKRRIHIKIVSQHFGKEKCYFRMMIENKSNLPLAITNISLLWDNSWYDCDVICRMELVTAHNGEIVRTQKNLTMPLLFSSFGAVCGFICFSNAPKIQPPASNILTFQIQTSRGSAIRMKLQFDPRQVHFQTGANKLSPDM